MYKIYGITQGQRNVDLSSALPWVHQAGTKDVIDFYLWCIKGKDSTVLVDTGMTDKEAKVMCNARMYGGIEYLKDKFKKLNIDPTRIEKVIISHLHADHFSAYELYPNATFFLQKREMEFFTGPATKFLQVYQFAPDMAEMVKFAYSKRVRFLDGDEQIAPGLRVVLVGGHTPGSQVLVVTTSKGEAVVCADAIDRYENLEKAVVGQAMDLVPALFALDKIRALASSPELIIPGHEPQVMKRFPNPIEGVVEIG